VDQRKQFIEEWQLNLDGFAELCRKWESRSQAASSGIGELLQREGPVQARRKRRPGMTGRTNVKAGDGPANGAEPAATTASFCPVSTEVQPAAAA
jgi:hypothetical protein